MNRDGFARVLVVIGAIIAVGILIFAAIIFFGQLLSSSTSPLAPSMWKTYHNNAYGFTITYPADQRDPVIAVNDTSPIYSSMVTGTAFGITFDDSATLFQNPIYNPHTDRDDEITYSTSSREWIVKGSVGSAAPCPEEVTTTNQGIPLYIIPTGFHAGDGFDAYVTKEGIIAVSQGVYFANDTFIRDEVTFDDPASVFRVGCSGAGLKK